MNCYELQALRKLLMLDVKEAAEHIGEVAPRTWQYWESGRSQVPGDVASAMLDWNAWRDQALKTRVKQINKLASLGERIRLNFYKTLDDFAAATGKRNVITWRISQSVAAELYSENRVELVESGGLAISQ